MGEGGGDGEERPGSKDNEEVIIACCEIGVDLKESGWPALHCTQAQERGNTGQTYDAHDHAHVQNEVEGGHDIVQAQSGGSAAVEVVEQYTEQHEQRTHACDENHGNDDCGEDDKSYATQMPMTHSEHM